MGYDFGDSLPGLGATIEAFILAGNRHLLNCYVGHVTFGCFDGA
jgi:hypothetical protein